MAALTAGGFKISGSTNIDGATIAPQGTVVTPTFPSPVVSPTDSIEFALTYGTGTGQADILCNGDYLLAISGTVTFDLYANGLPNSLGGAANFRKLKGVYVRVLSGGDTSGVIVGNAGANPHGLYFGAVTQTWKLLPGGPPLTGGDGTGVTVDATHRNLLITNGSGAAAVTVRVFLAGTSV